MTQGGRVFIPNTVTFSQQKMEWKVLSYQDDLKSLKKQEGEL